MGKDKKAKKRSTGLAEDILDSKTVKSSGRVKQRRERQGESEETVREQKMIMSCRFMFFEKEIRNLRGETKRQCSQFLIIRK